jgi:hypothetical protein
MTLSRRRKNEEKRDRKSFAPAVGYELVLGLVDPFLNKILGTS